MVSTSLMVDTSSHPRAQLHRCVERSAYAQWHDMIGEPTIADAILDRIIHNAHRVALEGDSMRRKKVPRPLTDAENSETNTN